MEVISYIYIFTILIVMPITTNTSITEVLIRYNITYTLIYTIYIYIHYIYTNNWFINNYIIKFIFHNIIRNYIVYLMYDLLDLFVYDLTSPCRIHIHVILVGISVC